jgi:membrane protease YdiL (CAAX protease family)
VAELAGIGLTVSFGVMHAGSEELPLPLLLPLDTLLRVLPAAVALALLFHRPRHFVERLGMKRGFALMPLLGLHTLVTVVNFGFLLLLGPWLPVDPTGGVDGAESGWGGLLYLVVSACVVAPLAEETLYRGVLFRGLQNHWGLVAATVVSSLLFSLVHFYDAFGTVSVCLLGVACALAYRATGSLAAVIVFHALYNLCLTVPDWVLHHSPW